jgi:hypothetical protein
VLEDRELSEWNVPKPRETRKQREAGKPAENVAFNPDTAPTTRQLFEASLLEVIDEYGKRINFGDLVRSRKTIVIFIRHWYCPLCAQYMNSILAEATPEALENADVDLVIIGNGSDKMINGYRSECQLRLQGSSLTTQINRSTARSRCTLTPVSPSIARSA